VPNISATQSKKGPPFSAPNLFLGIEITGKERNLDIFKIALSIVSMEAFIRHFVIDVVDRFIFFKKS